MEQLLGRTNTLFIYDIIQALRKELHLLKIMQASFLPVEDMNHRFKMQKSLNVRIELQVLCNLRTFNNRFGDFNCTKVSVPHSYPCSVYCEKWK